jgi:hypothetical protein
MTPEHRPPRTYIQQLIFEIVLLTFVGTLLVLSFDLGSRARMVPQLIGGLTFVLLVWQIATDIGDRRDMSRLVVERMAASQEQSPGTTKIPDREAVINLLLDEEEGPPPEMDPEAFRRLTMFAGWVVAYTLLSAVAGFFVSVPLGLWVILYLATKRVLKSLAITAGACVVIYLIFITMLDVQF